MHKFISKAQQKHNNKYTYNNVVYVNSLTKVAITCPQHGDFLQTPAEHVRGRGCPNCAKSKKSSTKEFIDKAKLIHGNTYTYDNVVYTNNSTNVTITCIVHGDFEQTPNRHLSQKSGCPKCAVQQKRYNPWSYSNWKAQGEKSKHFYAYTLYVLECWNDEERFIKVGKTFNTITQRYDSKHAMPYSWKVIEQKVGSADYISELERTLHAKYKQEKYRPILPFGGIEECFIIDTKSNIIKDINGS